MLQADGPQHRLERGTSVRGAGGEQRAWSPENKDRVVVLAVVSTDKPAPARPAIERSL